jgi:hypothetical protein
LDTFDPRVKVNGIKKAFQPEIKLKMASAAMPGLI